MGVTWKKTNFLGVRYREHATRKHGGNRPDKCFYIHHKVDGKTVDEMVGWSSEHVTAESAFKILSQLRENARIGKGSKTYAKLRELNEQEELIAKQAQMQIAKEKITFSKFWESEYLHHARATKKATTVECEEWLFTKWIKPVIGDIEICNLAVKHLDKMVNKAKKEKKSAATIRYILAVVSQIWSKAVQLEVVSGECPTKKIKKPRQDNRRNRYLSREEATALLDELKLHSQDMHDIAFLSLYTGMRAGEIHSLQWGNVNFQNNTIEVLDPKSGRNRVAFMTQEIQAMLKSRFDNQTKNALVFPGKNGTRRKEVSDTFERVVNKLGLNNTGEITKNEAGENVPVIIKDARQKVVFHTLRHTFASWLVEKGVPLYNVAKLMGHSTIDMTQRYSHLAPDTLRSAAMCLSSETTQIP